MCDGSFAVTLCGDGAPGAKGEVPDSSSADRDAGAPPGREPAPVGGVTVTSQTYSQCRLRPSTQSASLMDATIFAPSIVFEPLFDGVTVPSRATTGAAGYDVRAHLQGRTVRTWRDGAEVMLATSTTGALSLEPGDVALVPLGFRARLPAGYEAQVRLRSSIAFRRGLILPNAPGTIDADYPDEWLVMVRNVSAQRITIEHGERLAQIILHRYATLDWSAGVVTRSTDRSGGIGSTG